MYYDVMLDSAAFTVTAGIARVFRPAQVPLRDRDDAGFRFELAPGRPWQWTGPGGPADASLSDVLAAVNTARLTNLPGYEQIDLAAVQAAHEQAAREALAGGDSALAARLVAELGEVAATALVGEEEAARRLGISGRSLNNLRLAVRAICPPVLIAGQRRTKWFWAPAQFSAWQDARPGKGWRLGLEGQHGLAEQHG